MTAPYTQSAQFNPSVLLANNAAQTNKISDYSINTDTSFDTVFDNAAKSYADKTENTAVSNNSNDYANKTKDVHSSKENNCSDKKEDSVSSKKENNNNVNDKKENVTDKTDKNKVDNKEKTDSEKETAPADKTDKENQSEKTEQPENSDKNNTADAQQKAENVLKNEASQTAAAVAEGEITLKIDTAQNQETAAGMDIDAIDVSAKQNKNAMANEQILANIEYTDGTDIAADSKMNIDIDENALKKLVENAKAQTEEAAANPVENLDKLSKEAKVNNSIENIKITDETVQPADTKTANTELKTDINQTNQTKTTDAAALKTAQENLAADTSRLTANVEQMQPDAEVVTPAKTEAEKVPTIKVTQEVAATVQEQKSTGIENKDNTSKIKDKAVEQMTKLQDTDTVVTEAKTQDSAENSGSSGSGNNSAQANAGETAAKMNVEHASNINSQPADAQNFVSKLEAQLSVKSAESNRGILNQSDIMSQVNSKFEQLQQSGTNKVSIVLQPENLGKVSVEIMNSKDGIVAKMTTDNQQVKELFDKNVEALKNNLSSQGVNVNNIKVECTNESSNNAMNFERNQFEQSFNNQQNPHGNHANQSDKDAKTTYTADFGNANDFDEQTEPNQGVEIKNTQTIIKHNGKVDYTV